MTGTRFEYYIGANINCASSADVSFQYDWCQLTNAFGAAYGYDSNGNLTAGTNGHNAYGYDDENRLVQWFWYATDSGHLTDGALRTDFVYDGLGRLRERVEYSAIMVAPTNPPPDEESAMAVGVMGEQGSEEGWEWKSGTRYLYDGWRVIQDRDTNNVPLVSYTRGVDLSGSLEGAGGIGGLLGRSSGYSGGNWTSHAYYHADGNGNITCLINTNQSVVARYRYDPFGNTISKTGTLADANVYRFSSKEIHVNSAMYYYGYRFYDPGLQRWINRDPLSDEGFLEGLPAGRAAGRAARENLYGFVDNSPIRDLDPFGLHVFKGCRKREKDAIEKALKGQCEKAKRCAACTPAGEAQIGVDAICGGKNLTINCVDKDFVFSDGRSCKTMCGMSRSTTGEIYMCPAAYNNPSCGSPGCVLFHESLHIGGLPGGTVKDPSHPADFNIFAECMGCPKL